MRKFLPLGSSLDINSNYSSNGIDSGISYNIPENQREIATVTSNGVVTPISVGTVSVEISYGSGAPIAYYTVIVVTQEQYAKVGPLESGENLRLDDYSLNNNNYSSGGSGGGSSYTLDTVGTRLSGSDYTYTPFRAGSAANAFDGLDGNSPGALYWASVESFQGVTNAWLGKVFNNPVMIKQIKIMPFNISNEISLEYSNDAMTCTQIQTAQIHNKSEYFDSSTSTFKTITIDVLPYQAAIFFRVRMNSYTPPTGSVGYYGLDITPDAANTSDAIDRVRIWELELYT